jgi:hypothetical protein
MLWKYETTTQKLERLSIWHPWFAWYPVWFDGNAAWLTTIERHIKYTSYPYEEKFSWWNYRIISKELKSEPSR